MTTSPGSGADLEVVRAPSDTEGRRRDTTHRAHFGRTLCNQRTGLAWAALPPETPVTCAACAYLNPKGPDNAA